MDKNDIQNFATITQNLGIIREHAKEVQTQIDSLTEKLQLARGTGDFTAKAEETVRNTNTQKSKTVGRPSNKDRVHEVLKGHTLTVDKLVKETGISANRVEDILVQLKEDKQVHNIGSEDFPKYTATIGDDTNTKELTAEVRRLIVSQPMTMPELEEVTGAKQSRISGALVFLQRTEGSRVLNLGSQRRARWFLVEPDVKVAALQPKQTDTEEGDEYPEE